MSLGITVCAYVRTAFDRETENRAPRAAGHRRRVARLTPPQSQEEEPGGAGGGPGRPPGDVCARGASHRGLYPVQYSTLTDASRL